MANETQEIRPGAAQLHRTKGGVVHPRALRVLKKLGADISLARRARRIPAQAFADRMGVARATLHKLEHGDPGVSMNTLVMALIVLDLEENLRDLVDATRDDVGLVLARRGVPERVVLERRRGAASNAATTGVAPAKVATAKAARALEAGTSRTVREDDAPSPGTSAAPPDDEPEGW